MALAFPYYYISCPCSDASRRALKSKRLSRDVAPDTDLEDEEETFDSRHPRSAFSLFPPENLLYCEECHEIKCSRCVTEEIICYYCPSCLFETPSSMARGEGNRCNRNCLDCPICNSQLITAAVGQGKDTSYILNCNYCMWNTLDIGIKFEKPTNIRSQLEKLANGGQPKLSTRPESVDGMRKSSLAREPFSANDVRSSGLNDGNEEEQDDQAPNPGDTFARFHALKSFYKDQITSSSTDQSGFPASTLDLAYSSPSSLTRIMNLYSNMGNPSYRKSRQKPTVMREALTSSEGFFLGDLPANNVPHSLPPITDFDYQSTTSISQRQSQYPSHLGQPLANHISQLRPMPALLRTKRSKRCAACKHILVKPEFKPTSTRYRIKLTAINYILLISWKPLPGSIAPSTVPSVDGGDVVLEPGRASQWIMTLKNPLFENVKVSLGCPSVTPGRHGHRVTILCPQFEIGKNGDVWDDALNNTGSSFSASSSLQQISKSSSMGFSTSQIGEQVAGKLYDKGRNWVSVVVEIIPTSIVRDQDRELDEDEDVVEIPVRVRLEWKVTDGSVRVAKTKSERATDDSGDVDDGSRELSYWMVLRVGRVAC